MKVIGLDGKEYKINLTGYSRAEGDDRKVSSYHRRARVLLGELFPQDSRLEEIPLPGLPTRSFADFFLPLRSLVVEVQGEQHSDPDHRFHKGRMAYLASARRDQDKRRWCELNGLSLIELPAGENDDEWRSRIIGACGG